MIILFEKYIQPSKMETLENETLNLNDLWLTYVQNFEQLYPDTGIRSVKRDIKTVGNFFREDIKEILMGKEIEFKRRSKENDVILRGIVTDVWSRYMKNGQNNNFLNWEYKVKLDNKGKWIIIKRDHQTKQLTLKVFSKQKTELEEKLELLSSLKKYNI